jgi:CRISPR/Cas system-associated endoribonuclease Cas2
VTKEEKSRSVLALERGAKEIIEIKEIHTNYFSWPQYSTYLSSLVREVLDIRLKLGIVELATNKTFCIENTRDQVLGEKIRERWMTYVFWKFMST